MNNIELAEILFNTFAKAIKVNEEWSEFVLDPCNDIETKAWIEVAAKVHLIFDNDFGLEDNEIT